MRCQVHPFNLQQRCCLDLTIFGKTLFHKITFPFSGQQMPNSVLCQPETQSSQESNWGYAWLVDCSLQSCKISIFVHKANCLARFCNVTSLGENREISSVSFCFGPCVRFLILNLAIKKLFDTTKLHTWMFWFSSLNVK